MILFDPQALQFGFLDFNNFSVDDYEFYEVSLV